MAKNSNNKGTGNALNENTRDAQLKGSSDKGAKISKNTKNKGGNTRRSSSSKNVKRSKNGAEYWKHNTSDLVQKNTAGSGIQQGQKASIDVGSFIRNYQAGFNNGIESWNQVRVMNSKLKPTIHDFQPYTRYQSSGSVIRCDHTFGGNNNEVNSPLNLSAIKIKMYIDTQLGVRTSYEAQDLAIYLMAISDVIEKITEVTRDINLVNINYDFPTFMPHGIYDLLGICGEANKEGQYDTTPGIVAREIAAKSVLYIDELNQLIDLLNTLPIPMDLPLMSQNIDLYSKVYKDTDDNNAQVFLFASNGWWNYEETKWDLGSNITWKTWYKDAGAPNSNFRSIHDMIHVIKNQIYAITYNTESRQMIQDMYNAFGSTALLKLDYLQYGVMPEVIYDPLMAITIENAALMRDMLEEDIVADSAMARVMGRPKCDANGNTVVNTVNLPLQFHCNPEDITTAMIEAALRMHPIFRYRHDDDFYKTDGRVEPRDTYNCGWLYGFAIPTEFEMSIYEGSQSSGPLFTKNKIIHRDTLNMSTRNLLDDFEHAPMVIDGNGSQTETETKYTIFSYSGHRDTEVTIDLELAAQWFRAVAENAWNSAITRNTEGQRKLNG